MLYRNKLAHISAIPHIKVLKAIALKSPLVGWSHVPINLTLYCTRYSYPNSLTQVHVSSDQWEEAAVVTWAKPCSKYLRQLEEQRGGLSVRDLGEYNCSFIYSLEDWSSSVKVLSLRLLVPFISLHCGGQGGGAVGDFWWVIKQGLIFLARL